MTHLFSAFIFVGIMLEMFEINNLRLTSIKKRTIANVATSLLVSGVIYGVFLIAGWYSSSLVEELIVPVKNEAVTILVLLIVFYAYVRRNKYNDAGQLIYGSLPLYSLILVARAILHLISGFCLSLFMTNIQTFILSYAWGILLFSIAVILTKKSPIQIFGIPVGYIKMAAYCLSIIFIYT